jgi:hypothetical protein
MVLTSLTSRGRRMNRADLPSREREIDSADLHLRGRELSLLSHLLNTDY